MNAVEKITYKGIPYFVGQSVIIKDVGREGTITRIEEGRSRPSLFCQSGNMFGVFSPDSVELVVKTYKGFEISWLDDFDDYVHVGDAVGDDIFDSWLNALPPLVYRSDYLQVGEPVGHYISEDGKWHNTYDTLVFIGGVWRYMGQCCKGEDIHRNKLFYRFTA